MNTFFQILAWTATAAVLGSYGLLAWGIIELRIYHWANALAFLPIAYVSAIAGAWPGFVITTVYGLVAINALLSSRKPSAGGGGIQKRGGQERNPSAPRPP